MRDDESGSEQIIRMVCYVYGFLYLLVFIGAIIWMAMFLFRFIITPESDCGVGSTLITLVLFFAIWYVGSIVKAVCKSIKDAFLNNEENDDVA